MAKLDKATFIESLKEMSILEIKELVDAMKEEFGIDPTAVAAAPAAGAAAEAEQTEFTVVLKEVGAQKIKVIKVIKDVTGLGLMEANKLLASVPANVKEKVSKAEADDLKAQLEEAGAVVEIK